MSDLRTRIAAVVYRHTLFRALDQCECGAAFDGFCGRSLDAYATHLADAVIAELHLETTERYPTNCGTEVCLKGHYTKWVGND